MQYIKLTTRTLDRIALHKHELFDLRTINVQFQIIIFKINTNDSKASGYINNL